MTSLFLIDLFAEKEIDQKKRGTAEDDGSMRYVYTSMRQHTSACVSSIRTSAYASIRVTAEDDGSMRYVTRMLTYADVRMRQKRVLVTW